METIPLQQHPALPHPLRAFRDGTMIAAKCHTTALHPFVTLVVPAEQQQTPQQPPLPRSLDVAEVAIYVSDQ